MPPKRATAVVDGQSVPVTVRADRALSNRTAAFADQRAPGLVRDRAPSASSWPAMTTNSAFGVAALRHNDDRGNTGDKGIRRTEAAIALRVMAFGWIGLAHGPGS